MEVRVQDHTIPAGGHGCLFPVKNSHKNTHQRQICRYTGCSAAQNLSYTHTYTHTDKWGLKPQCFPGASITSQHGRLTANPEKLTDTTPLTKSKCVHLFAYTPYTHLFTLPSTESLARWAETASRTQRYPKRVCIFNATAHFTSFTDSTFIIFSHFYKKQPLETICESLFGVKCTLWKDYSG